MTEKMKTVCVGRYLVDVPGQAEVSLSRERMAGFEIDTFEEDESAFRNRVAAREAEIEAKAIKADSSEPGGMVEAHDLRIPDIIGRSLVFGRTRAYGIKDGQRVDDEWVSVEVHAHAHGVSFSLFKEFADEADLSLAGALLARLQVRDEGDIPNAPGFCIRRAIFVEPLPKHKTEHVVLHLGIPSHPDLTMSLASMPGDGSGHGLLSRTAEVDAAAGADELLRVSKLRSDKRSINGLHGEEVVERVREYNFTTGYAFNWETRGVADDLLRPYLSLEMQTGVSARPGGKPTDTSLHEDALITLWDSIASSIRLRMSDSPPPSGLLPGPSGPKLGTVASAGDVCPQSGWWECNAGGAGLDVHGGQVQYLRKGERLPQPLLLPRQNFWQKVRGIQPSVESAQPTAWKLVDKRQRPRTQAGVALAQPSALAAGLELAADGGRAVSIGTYARTGDPCPATGWWRCEDSHALDGARWFARGSVLPVATFQVPMGLFARPGGPEFIQRRSGWQLVRHAEASAAALPAPHLPEGPPVLNHRKSYEPPASDRDS